MKKDGGVKKIIFEALFIGSMFFLFGVVGGIEQDTITLTKGCFLSFFSLAMMYISYRHLEVFEEDEEFFDLEENEKYSA